MTDELARRARLQARARRVGRKAMEDSLQGGKMAEM